MTKTSTFSKEYWDKNYSQPSTMDCIGNAHEHVNYLYHFFKLEKVDVSSIIDLGFGYGYLFQKMMKKFIPYKACGIEPSKYAFDKARARKLKPVESTDLKLYNESLEKWCQRKSHARLRYDLGLCTSVMQYLDKNTLTTCVPILSERIKYLYLTVPTDIELERQVEELQFDDQYAQKRSSKFYREILSPHFTMISSKIWESKFYFDERTTHFTDLLYRS